MNGIEWKLRWREEIEGISAAGKLVFEFTIGEKHVYFPTHDRWLAVAPAWAKEQWQTWHDSCATWCKANRIPMSVVGDAHVTAEA